MPECLKRVDAVRKFRLESNMVDRSDLVLCYIQHKNGGAYKTIKYAEEQGKTILNLAAEY